MIVVISGHRDLDGRPIDQELANRLSQQAIALLRGATEVRLGGARGVDRIVLEALLSSPNRGEDQPAIHLFAPGQSLPRETCDTLARHKAREVSLHDAGGHPCWTPGDPSDRGSWLRRNEAMLRGDPDSPPATLLLAFSDGRESGGTAFTIALAKSLEILCVVIPIGASQPAETEIGMQDMIEV